MAKARNFAFKFGGEGKIDVYHDGRVNVKYFNVFGKYNPDEYFSSEDGQGWTGGKVQNYDEIFNKYLKDDSIFYFYPLISNYTSDTQYGTLAYNGVAPINQTLLQYYSIYRREYEVYIVPGAKKYGYLIGDNFYEDPYRDKLIPKMKDVYYVDIDTGLYYLYNSDTDSYTITESSRVYKGEWEPVAVSTNLASLYDYNVVNNKTYQYIIYPNDEEFNLNDNSLQVSTQKFANSEAPYKVWQPDRELSGQGKLIPGSISTSSTLGAPVTVNWNEWSICELIPEPVSQNIPLIKKAYTVNQDQIWRFRFSLKTGEQKQNIGRSDFQTLGQFPKMGYGNQNYASGDVSALLGSEIVLGTKDRYIERTKASRLSPLSTNEKAEMLAQWKKFVSSNNPKLLKDIKGQSWIVQIVSSGNTTENFFNGNPDTINFQWKQIEDTKNVIIYSELGDLPQENKKIGTLPYEPLFGKK